MQEKQVSAFYTHYNAIAFRRCIHTRILLMGIVKILEEISSALLSDGASFKTSTLERVCAVCVKQCSFLWDGGVVFPLAWLQQFLWHVCVSYVCEYVEEFTVESRGAL
jgi:hypothetical protein